MNIETTSFSMAEGNAGDMNDVEVCLRLMDIQSGLLRNLVFSLTVDFDTAGIHAQRVKRNYCITFRCQ